MNAPSPAERLEILEHADIEVEGRMPWSSNATLLCTLTCEDRQARAIYKPRRGERPLWDFPGGLDRREVTAYTLSADLGWDLVPETILRDGPHGVGSLQWFVDADFEQHYFTLVDDVETHGQLKAMCAFDFVANQTDRKGGHCLVDSDGHIWGIDNGLSFHREFKLRTVIWHFEGEPIPAPLIDDLTAWLDRDGPAALEHLDAFEVDAVRARAQALVDAGRFPVDESGRRHPWPLV